MRKSVAKRYASAFFAFVFFANSVPVALAPRTAGRAAPASGAAGGWTVAAQQAAAEAEYEISPQDFSSRPGADASYQAPNRAHNFRSHFERDAVRITPRTDEGLRWELSLSLVGYGRGADVRPVDAPELDAQGKRVDFHRGPLTEWYINDERGLEQGFTLSRPPEELRRGAATLRVPGRRARSQQAQSNWEDDSAEPAFVVLKLGGDLVPTIRPDGQAIDFAPRSGGPSVLRYAELKVVDALQNELPSHMEGFAEDGMRGIRLVFDDSDAVYPVTVDPLATNASWTGQGDKENAGFGWAVAGARDINGDGFDDVIVGAPFFDSGVPASGAFFVYFGSPNGLSTTPDQTFTGSVAGQLLGVSVAGVGNINGLEQAQCVGGSNPGTPCTDDGPCGLGSCEGYDDVVVGRPGDDRVEYYYGGPTGLQFANIFFFSPDSGFGHSVAGVGDINLDGFEDFAVGAPFHDDCLFPPPELGPHTDCGHVSIYHGSPTGPVSVFGIRGLWEGAQAGWTVAGGDVAGTIHSDVLIGLPGSPTVQNNAGYALLHIGSSGGLAAIAQWAPSPFGFLTAKPDLYLCSADRTITCDDNSDCPGIDTCDLTRVNIYAEPSPETLREQATEFGGKFVAVVGDINDDGKDDWVVGDPFYNNNAGQVHLYYGSSTIPELDTAPAWTSSPAAAGSLLGWSVAAAGDPNGDGVDDFLIGARGFTNPATEEGRASLVVGSTDGPFESSWMVEGNQFYAALGYSVDSAGDVNGDGTDDVIVGAINAKFGQSLEGLATLYLGSPGLTPTSIGDALGFDVQFTRTELQDFDEGVLSPQLAAESVGFGPAPGSLLLSTGRAADQGLGNTDWGKNGANGHADTAVFELRAGVPPAKKTFCFTSQFVTSEAIPDTDKAFFCFDREGGTCSSPTYPLSEFAFFDLAENAPLGHCIDVEGKASLFLHYQISDGGDNGDNDSAVILSRLYFSDLALPADVIDETTADGYFQNPAPQDVSRLAGTYSYSQQIFNVPGVSMPFDLSLFFDSGSTLEGVLGPKWTHSYESFASRSGSSDGDGLPDTIVVRVGTRSEYFAETPEGLYEPKFGGSVSSLTYDPLPPFGDPTGLITYVTKDRTTYVFDHPAIDPDAPPPPAPDIRKLYLTSMTDRNGNQISLSYDGFSSRLQMVVDTRGASFDFEYTSSDLLRTVRGNAGTPNEAEVDFGYDSGRLATLTDLDGRTTTFTTTSDGRILTATNADGELIASNTYESFASLAVNQEGERIVSRSDGRTFDLADPGAGRRFSYVGDAIVSIDRLDPIRQSSRQYDAKGRIGVETDTTGVRAEFDYDPYGNTVERRRRLPSEIVPRIVEQSEFDPRGNMTRKAEFPGVCIADPNTSCTGDQNCPNSTCGVIGEMTYDGDDNLRSSADHDGNRSTFDFDVAGNLIRSRDPLGHESTLTYGALPGSSAVSPFPVSTTNKRGFTASYEYDARGYLVRSTDAFGATVTHTWDALGRRTSTTNPLGEADPQGGHTTCYGYDGVGRITNVRALCNTPSEFVQLSLIRDAEGRVVRLAAADGATSRTVYSGSGQVVEEIDPLGQSERFGYDPEDRLSSIDRASPSARAGATGGLRITTSLSYDDGDRLTGLIESVGFCVGGTDAGATCSSDGDCAGSASCGARLGAEYDEIGNLVGITDPLGNVRRFEYDLLGQLIARGEDTDGLGTIDPNLRESVIYDGRGLQLAMTTARRDTIVSTYDAAGRRTGISYGSHSVNHTLDEAGNQVVSVLDGATVTREFDPLDRLSSRSDEFGNRVDGVRDLADRLTKLVYPSDVNGDGERDSVLYEYDDLSRMSAVVDWDGNRTQYRYDLVGNLSETILPDGSVVSYTYDAAARQTGISDPNGAFSATYFLNAAGVRTVATLSLPLDPNIPPDDVTYTYGPRNELLTSSAGASFTYDDSGNMVEETMGGTPVMTLGYDEIGQLTSLNAETYRYDVDGLRIETDRNGTIRRYVYDMISPASRLLEEQDEAGNVVARYVHGLGLISRDGPEGLRIYHYDSRGSTVALTDGAGAITDSYAYDPYGRPAGRTGSTDQPFRYSGRDGVFDDGNDLYYMGSRYYAPELQRFIQMDQAVQGNLNDTQSLNRYAFVEGNPIQRIDPSGEFGIVGAIVGGLAGAGLSTIAQCWDGCSVGEAFGAAAEGAVTGAIFGGNPAMGLVSGIVAGLSGAALGIVVEAYVDGKLNADEGGLFTEEGGITAAIRLGVGGVSGGVSVGIGKLFRGTITSAGRGAASTVTTFSRVSNRGAVGAAGRTLVRQPVASVTRTTGRTLSGGFSGRVLRKSLDIAAEFGQEEAEKYLERGALEDKWAP